MEVDLYAGQPFPFTAEWYETREHAPHLEQPVHRARMDAVATMATQAVAEYCFQSIVDLGAGDGGMLSLIGESVDTSVLCWGYDLMQSNVDHARDVRLQDVMYRDFVDEPIDWADLTIITECLEHLEHPHAMVKRIGDNAKAVIASSPSRETAQSHDACHAWVWDMDGYAALIEQGGFTVVEHIAVESGYEFQVIMGVKS